MIENYPKYPVELIYIPDSGMMRARASELDRARGAASDSDRRQTAPDIHIPRSLAFETNSIDFASDSKNHDLASESDGRRRVPERRQPYVYDDSVIFGNGTEYDARCDRDKGVARGNYIYDVDVVQSELINPMTKKRRER